MSTINRARRVPSYRLHKPTGQARVIIDGTHVYLGKFGSAESREKYGRLLAEQKVSLTMAPCVTQQTKTISVVELIAAYWQHVERHYVKDGRPTDEQDCIRSAIKPLKQLYSRTDVTDFGPLALKAVREHMVSELDWSRRYINKSIQRIRRMFRWGVANELITPAILQALDAVEGLQAGRTAARETKPRQPVHMKNIEAVKAVVKPLVADLIDLQLLTGARPGEIIGLAIGHFEMTTEIWRATLGDHKTQHFGKERNLYFGPKAQTILGRYMIADPSARLFPISVRTYRDAVKRACEKLKIPFWTPHWLRHNAGTAIREVFGVEASQVILGHANLKTTELYSRKSVDLANRVMRQIG